MTPNNKKAVCLFSGGLDSTTVLYHARQKGYEVIALTAHYGQMHAREIESARAIAAGLGIEHHVVRFEMPWGGSSLTDSALEIPKNRALDHAASEIPSTYVPARNMIFLSLAASLAEVRQASVVFIGANAIDYSGYPDCRPEFLDAFARMLELGTKAGVEGRRMSIEAPLLRLSKNDIVRLGRSLGVPFEKTWSCYGGGERPCGECDSCLLRQKGFEQAGLRDPLVAV